VPVPRRLEQAVGEPQGQDVLHRLLAEEVVDPEDLRLLEGVAEHDVQRPRGGEVGAERLLRDQSGSVDQVVLGEHLDGGGHGRRRDRQVQQAAYVGQQAAGLLEQPVLGLPHGLGERRTVVGRRRDERDPLQQRAGDLVVDLLDELVEGGADLAAELLVGAGGAASAADHLEVLRESPGRGQPVETGEQLAGREVAGRAEEDQHVRGQVRGHGTSLTDSDKECETRTIPSWRSPRSSRPSVSPTTTSCCCRVTPTCRPTTST
jgi:hypothetical protein